MHGLWGRKDPVQIFRLLAVRFAALNVLLKVFLFVKQKYYLTDLL